MVLAVLVSAVPFVLMARTENGVIDYLPIVSFAWLFIGVEARYLLPLDFLGAGGLPLLVLVAVGVSWRWWQAGMAGAALFGVLAAVNLVVFVDSCPWPFTPADVSVGSQPDYSTVSGGPEMSSLLAAVACAIGAVALSVGSRRLRANRRR